MVSSAVDPFDQIEPEKDTDVSIIDKLSKTSFSFLKAVIILFLILFIVFYIGSLTRWMIQKDESIVVQSFDTSTGKNLSGKIITDLLRFELERIKEINELIIVKKMNAKEKQYGNFYVPQIHSSSDLSIGGNEGTTSTSYGIYYIPPMSPGATSLDYSISELGTIGMGGTSLSLGQILLSLKEFAGNRRSTLTGGLQRYGSNLSIVAILDDAQSPSRGIAAWEIRQALSNDNQSVEELIPAMVEDLAFQIAHDLSRKKELSDGNYPQTWQAFKYLTLGKEAYKKYNATRNMKDLDGASCLALLAKRFEPNNMGSSEFLLDLGFTYLDINNFDKASRLFQNTTELRPSESAFGLGMIYAKQGRYEEALNNLSRAIELNSSYRDALFNRGLTLSKLDRTEGAINDFDRAIQLDPNDAYAWNNKGVALDHQRDYTDAIKAFDEATGLDPNYVDAWYNKGVALGSQRRYDKAIEAYDEAIRLDPNYVDAWNNKGVAFAGLGNMHKAIEAYDEAIRLDLKYTKAWGNKGLALYYLDNYTDAIKAFDEAIRLDPNYVDAWNNKGMALFRLGKYSDSLRATDKALEIDPQFAEAWDTRSRVLTALERTTEADAASAEAKKLGYKS